MPALEPRVISVERVDGAVELALNVPASLACFPDHFPNYPMLPGVLQIGWAVDAARREFAVSGAARRIVGLKFMQPIRPGADIALRLERMAPGEIRFSYRCGDTGCSSGRLQFGACGTDASGV
ncbi:acyl-CoA synthetase [Sinimarinibacterium sp. CAU 1509]|uniref:ApeI family dehydratase n=1 Tax=Sinimarinibacterium sp. CAU 1509 TaxID=2562283 RepID=UPI0010ABEA88|nr:acyl-CoA synthetase [Sinimarinibacterium sp. CAU 1509]TJY58293.1 acyl-CoA synthetase [Sinimarinibacterium sp. CAU 1509]